ncbi:hypothetical protein H5410_045482 [Solanum commersonii]|uniref:PPIase cyclophilin-type domain-containing protein n=1 Tax=Solanum commersonii TaxID=4109 RepID=A0A9J5XDS6_SOLCO|nr:hypothetical protein H5410_045482 [Solanum commersonii]
MIDDDVRLDNDWMPKDEELGVHEEKEAHSRAVILESVGDIPDAEMKCALCLKRRVRMKVHIFTDHDPLTESLFSFQAAQEAVARGTSLVRSGDDEIHSYLKHSKRGVVAMAKKNPNATQFYITDLDYLDTVFGENGEGNTIVKKLI